MKIIRNLTSIPFQHCVAAIGNFDGVHLGHQAVLADLKNLAIHVNLPAVAILFEPQPGEFFRASEAPARLTTFQEKITQIAKQQLDAIFCVRFQQSFADLTAEDFVVQVLVNKLGIKALFVGDDFRFGKHRQGSVETLQMFAQQYHFTLKAVPTALWQNKRISSTRVRAALQQADFELARHLLGRPYQLSGRVIHGDKRGTQIGFPTANILLKRHVSPLRGVFVVRVFGLGKQRYGVANIGSRPTVDGSRWLIEIHIFEFSQTIYGQKLQIEPMKKLREEIQFTSLASLTAQIAVDVDTAEDYCKDLDK